ncbi:MAG: acyl-CoA synthetase [Deltaproteobacteria bacterium]|nr:acyl-CoA synthetase [Deltaproteobacteria bacterium]
MELPLEQQAIRGKCIHPSGRFVEFPKEDVELSMPARFEKIAARYGHRTAVKSGNQALTYQDLNQAANRLAHAIVAQRGKVQEPIALLMEHDIPLFVAIIGVLKAGKICLVLDPSFPKDRSAFLLQDSQASLLIADGENFSLAREFALDSCGLVNIDQLGSAISSENPGLAVSPQDFAFLIYTSGSTGRPKGVIQTHANLLHDSLIYCNGLHICVDDRIALLYSCSASQGVKITFATLLNGAALYPFNIRQQGVALVAEWLIRQEVTIFFSVPVLFRQFAATLTGEELFPHLRIIQLGSDLVTPREIEEYQRHFSANTILVIRFGTTETGTVRRMYFDSESSLKEIQNAVGYATEGADICLIDDNGAALPCDAVGEIVVKSRYLSPGYWRCPDLSREKFIPDPNDGDQRIFHTGDLGRLRSDGRLYHLGRKDFQLSVHGYRVEAGEIETVLLAQENVKEALVATAGNSNGAAHDRLVAYIVAFEKPFPATSILRRAAGQKLPAHMVPSDFVFLESLPLTPNGKVDRLALPAPDRSRPELEVAYAAPRSDVEELLAKIWAEVLAIDLVGIHDNFFDLGGHSLAASRVISRVIQSFKLVLPVKALYDAPTVARMAEFVKQNHAHRADDAELEQMLRLVETMTEEEAQRYVAEMSSRDAIK